MSAAPTLSQADEPDSDGWERALLDRQLERLDKLADMGLALAGEIQRRAAAGPDDALTHAAIDFARVSRAVRMTLALQSKLVRDFKTPPKAGSAKADNDDDVRWEVAWIDEDYPRKVRDSVRRVAEDSGLNAETVERLAAEAGERMERDDVYADVMTRSFDEIVAQICEDLGLKTPLPYQGRRELESNPAGASEPSAEPQTPSDPAAAPWPGAPPPTPPPSIPDPAHPAAVRPSAHGRESALPP
jgi:hypothetical protein